MPRHQEMFLKNDKQQKFSIYTAFSPRYRIQQSLVTFIQEPPKFTESKINFLVIEDGH